MHGFVFKKLYITESKLYNTESKLFQRVNLEVIACDYDRIGTSDPIGRVTLGYNRKGTELKHWREMVENPRRPVIHWHALQVRQTNRCVKFLVVVVAVSN